MKLPDFTDVAGKRLLIALSGGADSVALTHMLSEARPRPELIAAHIHHGIRGEDADRDVRFCESFCKDLSIPLKVLKIDVPKAAAQMHCGLETAARTLRYEALRSLAAEYGCEYVALAHHRDDLCETVLMHVLRGAGLNGLVGMRRISGDLYRPLLDFTRAELRSYLDAHGLAWREDGTNAVADNPRNTLRLEVLPKLKALYPGMDAAIVRLSDNADCDNDYLEAQTEEVLRERVKSGPFGKMIEHPEAIHAALLRRVLLRICPCDLGHDKLTEILKLADKRKGATQIAKGLRVERAGDALYICDGQPPKATEIPLAPGRISFDELEGYLLVAPCEPIVQRDHVYEQVLNAEVLKGSVLRTRRSGDHIRPLGCGDRLLSDVMTDRKLDRPLRDFMPLLAKGDRIYWAIGLCVSEDAKITPDTKNALRLAWCKDSLRRF